jgi:hypothetical protein
MRLLGWSLWGLTLLLSGYALWIAKREIPKATRDSWSPQALDDYALELKVVGDVGLIVFLLCIFWLFVWMFVL